MPDARLGQRPPQLSLEDVLQRCIATGVREREVIAQALREPGLQQPLWRSQPGERLPRPVQAEAGADDVEDSGAYRLSAS